MSSRSNRPLLWVCVSFILGIVIHKYYDVPFLLFSFLAALFLFLSIFIRHSKTAAFFLLLAFFCAGALYAKNYETVFVDHINGLSYGDRSGIVLVEGTVVSDVEPRPFFKGRKTVFSLAVKRLKSKWGWRDRQGTVLVNLFRDEDIRYGDSIIIEGKMHRPFTYSKDSRFSYREYLYRRGVTFILSVKKTGRVQILKRDQGRLITAWSLRLKHRLSNILKKDLPPDAAGLMQAFLLGDRYNIPKGINDLFKVSGVAHIIAISGFNIGIVAHIFMIILKMFPIPRAAQYIFVAVLLILYAFMTGGQPPVIRATIMAIVFLMSFLIERKPEPINTLAAAALVLLLMNPLNLFDAGFQLSFISVLFIIWFYPWCMGLFSVLSRGFHGGYEDLDTHEEKRGLPVIKRKAVKFLLQSVSVSVTAYMGVVPLVVYYFKLVTPVVILANLVVVPLASLIMLFGMGLLIVGMIFPFLVFAFANCLIVLLNMMIVSVYLFAQMPGSYFPIENLPLWVIFAYYGAIIIIENVCRRYFRGIVDSVMG